MIKKLIFLATFIASILFFTVEANADRSGKSIVWKVGDPIRSIIVCKTEEDILEIGLADTRSMLEMNQLVQLKVLKQSCLAFNPPLHLEIAVIVGDYKDYNGRHTTMVGVSPIGDSKDIVGYLIVLGRPLTI